jgi:pimeloyl-ACP methyl ester carboxylesterase
VAGQHGPGSVLPAGSVVRRALHPEIEPRYGEIRTPTLVLWGENDNWLDRDFGRRLSESIPKAHLSVVPNAGHFLPEEQAGTVASELTRFFNCS